MAAILDELIDEVADARLRTRLKLEADAVRQRIEFGIAFQRHSPEVLLLNDVPVRPGSRVALRGQTSERTFLVRSVDGDTAQCVPDVEGDEARFPITDLVVAKRDGEAVFPTLREIASVQNTRAPGHPHHLVIEGENHSALQLLRWLYAGRVDCIYIDPPYNTGSSDWKYNNNYIDKNDSFKSSKWLSMMERRLLLAKDLLSPDGVMVVAIDDYEVSNLTLLLKRSRLFRRWTISPVVVQHNPRGTRGNISRTHEYALFLVPPGRELSPIDAAEDELRDYRRRGNGENNSRQGRWRSFFAIHVDPETRRVVGIGPEIPLEQEPHSGPTPDGLQRIYPLGRGGVQRAWRNSRETAQRKIEEGLLRCTPRGTIVESISGARKRTPIKSVWTGARYNAGEYGTNLVKEITGINFPYPKSIYTVLDCLRAAVGDRPEALVLDFFGGSGTTLNAVCLLNAVDGGSRRCVLVTNNEIGTEKEQALAAEGIRSGDERWEREGICRSITWPRCAGAITGLAPDGRPVRGDVAYETWVTSLEEREAEVKKLPFVAPAVCSSPKAIAALRSWLGLPRDAFEGGATWFVPPILEGEEAKHCHAVLLDPADAAAFVAALADRGDHVTTISYVPPEAASADRRLLAEIKDALAPVIQERRVARPVSEGFPANAAFLRLEFLDPLDVERGARLQELVPSLWAMAGARGAIPRVGEGDGWVMPEDGRWALLVRKGRFRAFLDALRQRPDVDWVFLVSPSDEGFADMSALLPDHVPLRQRIHLYQRYVENFAINGGIA